MNKTKDKSKSFIWDLDGTILDSYEVIEDSLCKAIESFGISTNKRDVSTFIHRFSVGDYLVKVCKEYGSDFDEIKNRIDKESDRRLSEIKLIPQAEEILTYVKQNGGNNYVYTHRGGNSFDILGRLGVLDLFTEIVTSESGFSHKPSPEALLYLIEKYNMPKDKTFYVGDRNLDVKSAVNAGVKGILYLPSNSVVIPTGDEYLIVDELVRIKNLL